MLPVVLAALIQASTPNADVQTSMCEFGEAYPGKPLECLIEFTNRSDEVVEVEQIAPSFGDRADLQSFELAPKGTRQVRWQLDVATQMGYVNHYLRYRVKGSDQPRIAAARGFVASILDQHRPLLDLGVVDMTVKERTPAAIKFSSREAPSFRLTKVLVQPDYLDVKIGEDGRSVQVSVKDEAEWAVHDDHIRIETDAPQQPVVAFEVKSVVQGDVAPGSNPYAFGLMRTGTENSMMIPISRRSGGTLKLGKLKLEGIEGKVVEQDCLPKAKNCRIAKVMLSDQQKTGRVLGELKVALPDEKRTLSVQIWGLLLKPDTKIRDFDEETKAAKKQAEEAPAEGQSRVVGGQSIGDALRRAAKSDRLATPPGNGPLIRWGVANEAPLYGYVIYRAESADGTYTRVNKETIKVESEDGSASSYAWRDTTAVPGHTYWYYVGQIDKYGEKKNLTEPAKAVAK